MPKINQEEYEVLKGLGDKWKWIARDGEYGGLIFCFREKPHKDIRSGEWGPDAMQYKNLGEYELLFQFIKWSDEEPYSIAELIEEYEVYAYTAEHFSNAMRKLAKALGDSWNESEETEVKNIEWLKREIHKELESWQGVEGGIGGDGINEIMLLINQLDEPEVLSQELPVIPKFVAEWYEKEGSRSSWWNWFYKWGRDESSTELETKAIRWMQDFNEELFVDMFRYGYEVEEEQKYYVLDAENVPMLAIHDGEVNESRTHLTIYEKGRDNSQFVLTEQEIKDYDPRYWAFREPVDS